MPNGSLEFPAVCHHIGPDSPLAGTKVRATESFSVPLEGGHLKNFQTQWPILGPQLAKALLEGGEVTILPIASRATPAVALDLEGHYEASAHPV